MKSFAIAVAVVLLAPSSARAGQFKVAYSQIVNPQYQAWQAELQSEKVLEEIVSDLNGALTIPTDVTIALAECQTANAFYNPKDRAVIICYELIDEFSQLFAKAGAPEAEAEAAVMNATAFFFYHEIGHALIDVLDLPITGKEEDAVDQLSTYVLLAEAEADGGEVAALDGAVAFLLWAQEGQQTGATPAFWDEHSLDQQRFFNIVCWVYGQNAAGNEKLVTDGLLPETRAARCPDEWAQIDKAWNTLLAPSLK